MNVLYITARSDIGGGPSCALKLMKSLKNEVDIYLAAPMVGEYSPQFKLNSKDFFRIPHRSFSLIVFLKLIIWSYKKKIEIVHSHGRGAGIYSRLMYLFGFKVVHTYHGIHADKKSLKGRISLCLELMLLPFANRYIFCSNDEKNYASSLGIKPVMSNVIVNGVETDLNVKKNVLREFLCIGVLARNDVVKNYTEFFSNVKALNKVIPCLKFFVAGAAKNEFYSYGEIPENIEFLGALQNVDEFFSNIDILVSHSVREGMPLSVLEAMALGKPCLLSNVPGHKYFIDNQVSVGFELGSFESFLAGFEKISNLSFYENLSISSKNFISANHSTLQMARRTLSLYREV